MAAIIKSIFSIFSVVGMAAQASASWQINFWPNSTTCPTDTTGGHLTYMGTGKSNCIAAGMTDPTSDCIGVNANLCGWWPPLDGHNLAIQVMPGSACYWSNEDTCLQNGAGADEPGNYTACVSGANEFAEGEWVYFFCEEAS